MITLECVGCKTELKVPENRVGLKGKCPKCKAIITVPEHSEDTLIFDEAEVSCENKELQRLYAYLVDESPVQVKKHNILEDNHLALEIVTGQYETRTQNVSVNILSTGFGEFLQFITCVGTITEPESAVFALRAAFSELFCRPILSDKNELLVVSEMKLTGGGEKAFAMYVQQVATLADRLEEEIFQWDLF